MRAGPRKWLFPTWLLFAWVAAAGAVPPLPPSPAYPTGGMQLSPADPSPREPDSVPAASAALAAALDDEIRRVEQHAQALQRLALELKQARDAERRRLEAARGRVAEMAGQLQVWAAGSPEVNGLYDRIVGELLDARPALGAALDRARRPSELPVFEPRFEPEELDVPALADRLQRLRELRRRVDGEWQTLFVEEAALRRESVEGWGSITERLNALRIETIESLPATRRRQVLGINREGMTQIGREIEQLKLTARLYRWRQSGQIARLPERLLDVFAVGQATWKLLKVLAALLLFFFLRRRGALIRRGARRLLRQLLSTPEGQARGEMLVGLGEVLAPWGLFLVLIWALRWSIGPLALKPEFDLPLRVAALYGVYRLAIDSLFAGTLRAARRYRLSLDEGRTAEVLRSVRTMVRVVVGIVVLLIFSERLVGRGYLYSLVVRFAWVFVLGAALLLLVRWRVAIADAYLGLGRRGRLAALVRRSRDRWYGVFLSAAAFVLLAGRAAFQVGQDFAMGFDQTRRALAFLFRRRLEKHAEQGGYAEGNVAVLPPGVVEVFAESPITDGTPVIDHYPGLDRLLAMIDPWLEEETGASFLLTGEKGMGKTSWLGRVQSTAVPVERVTLNHRVLSESRLVGTLTRELELPLEDDAGMQALRKALLAGPKRIVVVDLGQNLFLGKVGGYDTFESFVSLVEATSTQIFWVCSISAFAWVHLAAVRPDLIVFRDREALFPWSEEQVGQMLQARTQAAGVEIVYDDLLRDPARRLETAQQYTRLLWDYSDGNPRVALHYWLRSLVPDSERRLRVRLFRAPAASDLDDLSNRSRFLLAAIVVHENLTLHEAVLVTRYPMAVCRLQLERLHDDGILRRAQGRYRLTTHWHRAAVRFLRRGNLLSD